MRVLGIDHHQKYIEIVKSIVDQDWLVEELQKVAEYQPSENPKNFIYDYTEHFFHPLAYLIYIVQKQFKENNQVTEEISKLSRLGEALEFLREQNIPGLDEKIKKLISKDKKGYEKTRYEIQIAFFYAKKGYFVEFIETESLKGQKTPDLLIRKQVEIECKKVDTHSRRDTKNINRWREIIRSSSSLMSRYKQNCSLFVKTKKDPDNKTVGFIIKKLDELLRSAKEGGYTFPTEGVHINIKYLTKFNQEIETNSIKYKYPHNYDYFELDQEISKTSDGKIRMRNSRIFRFMCEIPPDRVTRVIKAINTANSQLSGTKPGVIYIDLNHTDKNMSEEDLERLRSRIVDRLRQNSTITAVVLTTEDFIRDQNIFAHSHIYKIIDNGYPKHKLPADFKVIGE